MVSTQPEALRLADALAAWEYTSTGLCGQAAAELRRLHEVNQELLRVLELTLPDLKGYWEDVVRNAITKATGEQA